MSRKPKKPEKPLTEKQKQAVAMVYDWLPKQDIAAALGIHRSTLWRWEGLPAFRREWRRIDRNLKRKYERHEAKRRAAEEIYWEQKRAAAEGKLQELGELLNQKQGKALKKALKDYNSAWKTYEKTLCHGRTLAELTDIIFFGKRKRHKVQAFLKAAQQNRQKQAPGGRVSMSERGALPGGVGP